MQNPFRHRPQDDFGRQDHERDDRRWEARDQRFDEGSSWSEGDGGRSAEAFRNQGQYGREDRQFSGPRYGQYRQGEYGGDMSSGWGGDRPRAGGSFDRYGYGSQSGGYGGQQQGGREYQGGAYGRGGFGGRTSESGSDWRMQRDYGRYPEHAYAPGSQIWESSGQDYYGASGRRMQSERDFEPDYLHWRQQQLSNLDRDYDAWRSERRQKFASDFDSWRQSRPRSETHRQADNPIVGDVSDGGTGNAHDAKKR